jgi:hypothetical protein
LVIVSLVAARLAGPALPQNKGRMAAMKKVAAEKKCAIDSEYSSRRSVY